jgi:hypothetical protein
MSASPAAKPVYPPTETRLRAGLKIGVIGLGLGLLGTSLFIIPQQMSANAVLKVFAEARIGLLTERFEREAWPADAELTVVLGPERAHRMPCRGDLAFRRRQGRRLARDHLHAR